MAHPTRSLQWARSSTLCARRLRCHQTHLRRSQVCCLDLFSVVFNDEIQITVKI